MKTKIILSMATIIASAVTVSATHAQAAPSEESAEVIRTITITDQRNDSEGRAKKLFDFLRAQKDKVKVTKATYDTYVQFTPNLYTLASVDATIALADAEIFCNSAGYVEKCEFENDNWHMVRGDELYKLLMSSSTPKGAPTKRPGYDLTGIRCVKEESRGAAQYECTITEELY